MCYPAEIGRATYLYKEGAVSRGAGRPLSMTSIISASGASVAAGLKRRDDGPSAAYLSYHLSAVSYCT